MQVRRIQNLAAWLTMVGVIMLSGLRAQADDPANGESPRATAESAADPESVEDHPVVEAAPATDDEPAGALTLDLSEDVLITAPGSEERAAFVLQINAEPAGDVFGYTLRDDDGKATALTGQPYQLEELGKTWIGVQINDVSPALRAHLNLDKGQGVLIGEVVPDSPASKAGVKQYDILLAIGDQKVGRDEDVLMAVKAADGKEIKLTLLRGGSERTLNVTPAERPKRHTVTVDPITTEYHKDLNRWFQLVQPGTPPGTVTLPKVDFNVVKPGGALVLRNTLAAHMTLPDGLTITVTREGQQPAKISIKQKEREIETTEDKLNELPEDLRRYVEPMLGRGGPGSLQLRASNTTSGGPPQIRVAPPRPSLDALHPAPPGQEGPQKRVRALPRGRGPQAVERRIEELERRLDELQREVRSGDEKKRDESK
ncbi:MAG: PDZ domain-containing protein [Pirellulales bacterium]